MLNTLQNSILNMEPLGVIAWSIMISIIFVLLVGTVVEAVLQHIAKRKMTEKLDQKQKEIFGDDLLPEWIKATDEQIGIRPEGTE
jgi:hypothetical protein